MTVISFAIAASVLLVLATALPPDSISQATANPSAFASALASSVSAGDVPGWYQSLPADVKSYLPKLYPVAAAASTTAPATSAATSTAVVESTSVVATSTVIITSGTALSTVAATGATISSSTIGSNSTVISTVSSATLKSTGGTASGTGSPATGAASYPTVVAGAGVAGAMAFLGMLAM
ncbi:hypothetical protein K491DRAFT_454497 [Lophiostoma macrostomum CBS 122681]|uniref:Uncharacterized protein n=1 Tax=Lophiostoma macrostomum CBS 122681 TaxID=1314788 RepID=A0A6A6TPS3_9PLEO|nr:hypothetical protein K491DRAFT_454497 [Lophiostoma macrostomum CBS 122681]